MTHDANWLVTREDLRRFETVVFDALATLLRATAVSVKENPDGYAFYETPTVRAFLSTNPHARLFRWAIGLTRCSDDDVQAVFRFFKSAGVKARFRIPPDGMYPARAKLMTELGLAQSGFHTILYAPVSELSKTPLPVDPDIQIEEVQSTGPVEDFLDVQIRGWGVPEEAVAYLKHLRRCWIATPGHRSYLAKIDGKPAAHAMLYESGDIAYLSGANTLPEYRRRGLQTALIHRRIADARAAGQRLVIGGADFESNSRMNMMRCGLRIAYTAAWWDEL